MASPRHIGGEVLEGTIYVPTGGEPTKTNYRVTARDVELMGMALEEAKQALELGNHPVGAVLVNDTGDIWAAHADEESAQRINGHAERNVFEKYNRDTGKKTLKGLALYVNIVPCVGCSYAIDQGELGMLYYGADRDDIIEASRALGKKDAVRQRSVNMVDILTESPRTLYVIGGLLKEASVELYQQKHWREEENFRRLTTERRKGF